MLASFVNQFYRNSRLLILTLVLIVVWGVSSYVTLPRLEDPELVSRAAKVTTIFPGASAERVEALITEPLEKEFTTIDELLTYQSTSQEGSSTVVLELDESLSADDVDLVWSRARDKMTDVAVNFPPGALEPEFDEFDIKAYALIAALTWTQDDTPNYGIMRRLITSLEEQLKRLSGTEATDLFGVPDEEILVEVESAQLASLGLTVQDVAQQLSQSDAKQTAGQFRGSISDLSVDLNGELDSLNRIRQTPIEFGSNDQFIYVGDLARVAKGTVEPLSDMALVSDRPAVIVGAFIQSSTRIDRWAKQSQNLLKEFEALLPPGLQLTVIFDQNTYVTDRLNSLMLNLVLGAVLVFGVTLLMMGWRASIIVGLSLPLSLLMVLGCMRLMGVPLHQMSVMGLVVALGILIDTAIVMVDDVNLHLRKGHPSAEAIALSTQKLALPLFSSTITTVLSFTPIAILPGSTGEFVGTIGISVIFAISCSFFLSITVIPALAAKLYERTEQANVHSASRQGIWQQGLSLPRLAELYEQTIDGITRRPWVGIAIGLALPLVGVSQIPNLELQFFPPSERDQLQIELELPASTSIQRTQTVVRQVRDRLIEHPEVEDVQWFLGKNAPRFYYNVIGGRENESNYAQALVQLNQLSSHELTRSLQADVDQVAPQARTVVRQLEQGPPFDAPIELRILGQDVDELRRLGEQVRSRLAALDHVTHTRSSLDEAVPQIQLTVDEEKAQLLGLDKAAIAQQLNTTLEGIEGGSVLEATEELPVRVRLSNDDRGSLAQVESINLLAPSLPGTSNLSNTANWIPLSSVADVSLGVKQAQITRYEGQRANTIQGFVEAGILPDTVMGQFRQQLEALDLPLGYRISWGGEAAERSSAIGGLLSTIGVLVVIMIAVLVLSLGSFQLAALIFGVAATAFGLGIFGIALFGYPFGFNPIIGTVGLLGVAINDSIVVLAALNDDPQARLGNKLATRQVVMHSTRHVLTTTFTTMIGFVPLLLAGGEFWPPLAVAIAGGVGGATLVALYLVPSAYLLTRPKQSSTTLAPVSPSDITVTPPKAPAVAVQQTQVTQVKEPVSALPGTSAASLPKALPQATTPLPQARAQTLSQEGQVPTRTYKIACIDDSSTILQSIDLFLDDQCFQTILISDPVRALAVILRHKPDIILLDILMPNLDGYQLCSLLRQHPLFKDTPIVMATSQKGLIDKTKAKMCGASGYLVKPFNEADLMSKIFRYLE